MNDNCPSSMIEMFLANARDEPDRVVLNYKLGDEWQDLGWGVIARHASRYAAVLRDKGVQAGDRVILFSAPESIRKVENMFAVQLEYF